jgi:putative membrane protein
MTHNCRKTALAAALFSLGFTVGAFAQGTPSTTAPKSDSKAQQSMSSMSSSKSGSSSVASGDRKFVEKAAMDGMAEVEMGKLAASKATNDQVKQFAQRMVTDHGKANDELKSVASSKGIQVPASVDKKHQKDMDEMQKKDAKKFDHEYMEMMVKEHKKDVSEFEKQSKSAKDPDIKAFASKTLPTLKEHLQMAQSTQAALKGGGGAARSGSTAGNTGGTASSGSSASGMSNAPATTPSTTTKSTGK